MSETEYLSIADFASRAGVSKQAIYKQIRNENSQIAPYLLQDGKRTFIKVDALNALYRVENSDSTFSTPEFNLSKPIFNPIVNPRVENQPENSTLDGNFSTPKVNPSKPIFNPDSTPEATEYIEFLKSELAEAKAANAATEKRLGAIIAEKDGIIKEQSAQLAELTKQVAQIADKALTATSQQQYLTALDRTADSHTTDNSEVVPSIPEKPKKSFWGRLFGN